MTHLTIPVTSAPIPSAPSWAELRVRSIATELPTMDAVLNNVPRDWAVAQLRDLRARLGIGGTGEFVSMPGSNVKMNTCAAAGLTLAPSRELSATVAGLIADGLYRPGDTEADYRIGIATQRWNACPWSTPQCVGACVPARAGRGVFTASARARAVRTLLWAIEPSAAVRLWVDAMRAHRTAHGVRARARFAVADNVRWDLFAPAMVDTVVSLRLPAYAYTKADRSDHPAGPAVRLIRSATAERGRWDAARIVDEAEAGECIAMVFAVRKGEDLPRLWHGVPVHDGDATDDRTLSRPGTICGLRAKGRAKYYAPGGFVFSPWG
jgi:hypothetical protein